jgi:outer membrane biosynthesis protein TonB
MSRFFLRFSSALPLLALLACKLTKDDEQSDRPLPTPEPASTTPPARPTENEPPRAERPKETTPREPSPESAPSPKPTATAPSPTATTPSTSDAAAPAPTPSASSAPAPGADKLNQCISKCQASLSACLSKPVPFDAGVPSLESMQECKKAFEDCRTACTP